MRTFGFSTGAVALSDYRRALNVTAHLGLRSVEISALRLDEVSPLLRDLANLDLNAYSYISFHAPSSFSASEEAELAAMLYDGIPNEWPIILHPDAIKDFSVWERFGLRLAIENMDRRKHDGRTANELEQIFSSLPHARFCFDIGHARQCDPSMTEAYRMLKRFARRLVEVHLSEVNSESKHDPLSYGSVMAYRQVAGLIPEHVPIILESRVKDFDLELELQEAAEALPLEAVSYYSYA